MIYVEDENTVSSNRIDCNFKPFTCLLRYEHFIFICFRKFAISLFDNTNQSSLKFGSSIKVYGISENVAEICEKMTLFTLTRRN